MTSGCLWALSAPAVLLDPRSCTHSRALERPRHLFLELGTARQAKHTTAVDPAKACPGRAEASAYVVWHPEHTIAGSTLGVGRQSVVRGARLKPDIHSAVSCRSLFPAAGFLSQTQFDHRARRRKTRSRFV